MSESYFDRTEFIRYFKDESEELLQQLDADLLRLEAAAAGGTLDQEVVNSLFRALHTIKGSAGMLELQAVAALAHKLENVYDLLRKDRLPLTESLVDLLFEGRDLLTALVHAAIDGGDGPEGVAGFGLRLEEFIGVYQETDALIEGKPGEEIQVENEFETASARDIEAFEAEVARLLAEAGLEDHIPAARIAARRPIPDLPGEDEGEIGAANVFAADEARVVTPGNLTHDGFSRARGRTIRVDIARLDVLLDLVGELVINRTRLSEISALLARATAATDLAPLIKDLADSTALLTRTTSEMQDSIMKVRMIPIGIVFERFPRLARDVARARGKDVDLVIEGGETDLDKTIVDEVGEPLMHLIRNCVDHGIEAPDVRAALGKPQIGKISLRAFHEGNQIIVQIADDGAGIDLERVRARGVKQGLIGANDRLNDSEVLELIFTPGFSTADVVSDVSGRGVGMDVVKGTVTRLGGVFDVESVVGVGTTFTIRLPLTLAIIQALLVRLGDDLYAIPLDSVLESERIEVANVRTVSGGEVVTLRDRIIPLIRVGEFFELRTPEQRDPEKVMIVVVAVGNRQIGLIVDDFVGDQEIVIKPLSELVGRIPGISGATILGNGSIALIVDVQSLVLHASSASRATRVEFSGV